MKRFHVLRITALVAVAVLGSCAYDEYSIELTPQGDVIHRKLTVRRVGGEEDADVSAEKLDAIAELYGQEVETDVEGGHAFVGEFADTMPNDVGGAGEYITFVTRMGRCSAYIERFRGDDSPAERIHTAFNAADELTDLLIGWLEGELGKYEDFPKLRAFLDEQVRGDLKNLSVYLFLLDSASSAEWAKDDSEERIETEAVARLMQYFIEREYFLPDELPAVYRPSQESISEGDQVAALCPFIVSMAHRKADLQDKEMLAALGEILADSAVLEESLTAYVATTEEYQQCLAEWEQLADESPKPDPMAALARRAEVIFLWEADVFGSNDLARVALRDVAAPVATNGLWDEQARTISWSNRLNRTSLPAICYAVWAEPDAEFQAQRFGRAILEDNDLLKYCLWRKGLTDQEAAEWDEMIDRMQPDDEDSLAALKAFRFSHEPGIDPHAPEGAEMPPTYARTGIDAILGNIARDESEE